MLVDFKDYYKFPLKPMPGLELIKVLTDDNQMAFDWCVNLSNNDRLMIIDRINNCKKGNSMALWYDSKDCIVYISEKIMGIDTPLLRIRGWGHLTGIGGLNFSEDKAKTIQDKFGEYIVKTLNS